MKSGSRLLEFVRRARASTVVGRAGPSNARTCSGCALVAVAVGKHFEALAASAAAAGTAVVVADRLLVKPFPAWGNLETVSSRVRSVVMEA